MVLINRKTEKQRGDIAVLFEWELNLLYDW